MWLSSLSALGDGNQASELRELIRNAVIKMDIDVTQLSEAENELQSEAAPALSEILPELSTQNLGNSTAKGIWNLLSFLPRIRESPKAVYH